MIPPFTGPLALAGAALTLTPTFSAPTRIDNPCLPLSKFSRCVLAGSEGGERVRAVHRLLSRTEAFEYGGESVRAAVIRDSEFANGALVERTLDYVAQADDGTVHYFGEDVNEYEHGRLLGHGGA